MTQRERLHFLLDYLIREAGGSSGIRIPSDIGEEKQLFRSFMNQRPPKPVSEEFLNIQDQYLKQETADKGIIDANALKPVRDNLYLWQGDITALKCGAIVNAANLSLTF